MESSDEIDNYLQEVKNQISSILTESNSPQLSSGCGCVKPTTNESIKSSSQSKNKPNSKTFVSKLASSSKKIHPEKNESQNESFRDNFSGIYPSEITPIEAEIDMLRKDLKKNYDIFENAREMLSELSFEMLSDRIKDLHMYPDDSKVENIVEKFPMAEGLDQLTEIMKERLNKHPGEFGGIPEITTFFKICSKLKLGMENLQSQSNKLKILEQRINGSIDVSGKKSSSIRTDLEKNYPEILEKFLQDDINNKEQQSKCSGLL